MPDLPLNMDTAISVNRVPIRLMDERWNHIIDGHVDLFNYRDDVLHVIEEPEAIYRGRRGSLIAVRSYGRRGFLTVFYRELSQSDGFVVTARFLSELPTGEKIWTKQ